MDELLAAEGATTAEREDRERRSRAQPTSPTQTVRFVPGNSVLHDVVGEARVRRVEDGKVLIEWMRYKRKRGKETEKFNRWVVPSSLQKLRQSPRGSSTADNTPEQQEPTLHGPLPGLAAHERARAAARKLPSGPRGRQVERRTTKESSIPIAHRLREFQGQGLKEAAGELFCVACKEPIPNIKSSIAHHLSR